MNFMIFFFVFFGQFLVSILYALGIGSMGSAGIITGIEQFSGSGGQIAVGVLMLLNGIGFGTAAAADFFMLVKIHRMYRSTGKKLLYFLHISGVGELDLDFWIYLPRF